MYITATHTPSRVEIIPENWIFYIKGYTDDELSEILYWIRNNNLDAETNSENESITFTDPDHANMFSMRYLKYKRGI